MKLNKVLITGASRGIGKAIAIQLAENGGYNLILHASSEHSLEQLVRSLPEGTVFETMTCNFADESALSDFIKELKNKHEDLYAIISNAGITRNKGLGYQPVKEVDEMLTVNLRVPILLAKAAMKIFPKRNNGVFIALSSCVAETGNAFQAVYSATKAANVAMCKSLAREAGVLHPEKQIRFVTVAPGFIETGMTEELPEKIKEKYLEQIPARRFGNPQDVAHVVEFLLSDRASYINGSEFKINGGLT